MNDQDANIIQSLSRGLAALDHVARQSTTPRSLAEAMGVDRSTAYRILVTLAAHGFVERDPLSEQYMISSRKLVALGSTVSASLHWHTLASPWLKQLRDETGEAVNIAVLQGSEVVYVNHLPSYEAITVSPLLGLRRPVHVSAVGKAIVAFLPPGEQDALLSRIELKAATPNTITIPREFRKELERVRALGSAATCWARILTATRRPRTESSADQTEAIPPFATWRTTR